jgi:ketosteroid isomerase-like protein
MTIGPEVRMQVSGTLLAALAATTAAGALAGVRGQQEAPDPAPTRDVAIRAFAHFKHGLATGQWRDWLAVLSDDFTFWFPAGKWRGEWRGKEKAEEFFRYVATVFPEGLQLTLDRVQCGDATCVFEFRDWGKLVVPGQPARPYKNRVALSLDVRGDRIVGYREYFGSDGQSN